MSDHNNNTCNRDFIYTVPEKIFNDTTLSINDLKIYMIIRSFMDTTGHAYPSNNWIAKRLGIDRRSVITCINNLLLKNYIVRKQVNERRYLSINTISMPEEVVISRSLGGDLEITGGGDLEITQLDQNTITSKIINSLSQEEFDLEQNLYTESEQQQKARLLRKQCLIDKKCQTKYEQLSPDTKTDKSFVDVLNECISHYATQSKPQLVCPQRLISWINRELRYTKTKVSNKESTTNTPRWTAQLVYEA